METKITISQAQEIIKGVSNGLIFTVNFVKRTNGEIRTINCRKGVRKGVTGQGLAFSPASKGLVSVFDMQKLQFRFIALETILGLSVQGQKYIVE